MFGPSGLPFCGQIEHRCKAAVRTDVGQRRADDWLLELEVAGRFLRRDRDRQMPEACCGGAAIGGAAERERDEMLIILRDERRVLRGP